jgi:hypothetical protein
VLVAPTPDESGLRDYLAGSLGMPVEELRLEEMLDIAPEIDFDREVGWRFFHLLGATLRESARAP